MNAMVDRVPPQHRWSAQRWADGINLWRNAVLAFNHPLGQYIQCLGFSRILINIVLYIRKWNESGFRPPLCTYRLNWARRTSWGWWDDWDDTVLQTQDSKFGPWRSEAEHATSPQYWLSHVDGEETFLFLSNRRYQ